MFGNSSLSKDAVDQYSLAVLRFKRTVLFGVLIFPVL